MGAPKTYKKEVILEAIKDSGAIVSTIARRLGCQWITAKKYIDKWEATKRAFLDEEEIILDMAEGTLFNSIKERDVQSAKWILSTKGKRRGYSERHEIEQVQTPELKEIMDQFVDTMKTARKKDDDPDAIQ